MNDINTIFSNNTIANIVLWAVFGLVVGIIVHIVNPSSVRGGIFGTILTGILGAIIGGFLANLIFDLGITGFNLTSIGIAVLGALILAFIERMLLRDNQHIKTKITRFE